MPGRAEAPSVGLIDPDQPERRDRCLNVALGPVPWVPRAQQYRIRLNQGKLAAGVQGQVQDGRVKHAIANQFGIGLG